MEHHIEIFTANCPVCDPVVKMVTEMAGSRNKITVHDLVKEANDENCRAKLENYKVSRVPAIAIDGSLLDCCQYRPISREDLVRAGIAAE